MSTKNNLRAKGAVIRSKAPSLRGCWKWNFQEVDFREHFAGHEGFPDLPESLGIGELKHPSTRRQQAGHERAPLEGQRPSDPSVDPSNAVSTLEANEIRTRNGGSHERVRFEGGRCS